MTQNKNTWRDDLSPSQKETLQTLEEQGYSFNLKEKYTKSDKGFVIEVTWDDPMAINAMERMVNGKLEKPPQLTSLVFARIDAPVESIPAYFDDLVEAIQNRSDKL